MKITVNGKDIVVDLILTEIKPSGQKILPKHLRS